MDMDWTLVAALASVAALAIGFWVIRSRRGPKDSLEPAGPKALIIVSSGTFHVPCVVMATSAFEKAGLKVSVIERTQWALQ